MGDVYGWIGLGLGQIVAWPQELELRRDEGNEVSLLTYGLLLVSMSLYLAHAIEILDTVTIVSVPVALVPNMLIAVTLLRRRIARGSITSGPRAATSPACESSNDREAADAMRDSLPTCRRIVLRCLEHRRPEGPPAQSTVPEAPSLNGPICLQIGQDRRSSRRSSRSLRARRSFDFTESTVVPRS